MRKCSNACCRDLPKVDYTSSVIKDVLIAGIADSEIRKDVLSVADLDDKSDKDVVALVEAKEMAIKAWNSAPVSGNAGLSSYRKDRKTSDAGTDPLKAKLDLKGKCSECRKEIALYRKFPSDKINKQPFKMCAKCYNAARKPTNNGISGGEPTERTAVSGFFVGSIEQDPDSALDHTQRCGK